MAKKGQKSKKNKKPSKRPIWGPLIVVLALALYLGVIWFYITQSYHDQPLQTGRLAPGETYSGADYSKSLDLRIAAKATYPSSSIAEVKDLGYSGNEDEQVVSFKVPTDKLTEFGLMMMPTSKEPAGGYPVMILLHGYYDPDQYNTLDGYLEDMNFYAEHGFVVIKPDLRGQGLSRDDGSPDGAYYSMAYNTDTMSLISAVKQTPYLNKNNINLYGHSMGAYIALRAAVLSPEIKNVILLSGPVADPEDLYSDYMAPSDQDNPVALKLRQTTLLKYGTPLTNPKFWDTTAPINYVKDLKADVQINVGTDDQTVPPKFSASLDAALNKANKPHQYYVYDGGVHNLNDQKTLIWQRSLEVLEPNTQ